MNRATSLLSAFISLWIFSVPSAARAQEVCPEAKVIHSAEYGEITKCTKFYSESPLVRPPADDLSNPAKVTVHVAYIAEGEDWNQLEVAYFIDRLGNNYRPVDGQGNRITEKSLPATMRMPTYRNMFLIYTMTGTLRSSKTHNGRSHHDIELSEVRPAILLDGCALDGMALGLWEGFVSKRVRDNEFDPDTLVPFQMEFSKMTRAKNLTEFNGPAPPDATSYELQGKITNIDRSILSSDGTTFSSLSELGEANPFFGSKKGVVKFFRFPGMHTPFDRTSVIEWTLKSGERESGMVPMMLTSPWSALLNSVPSEYSEFSYHGMPNGFFMKIRPVQLGSVAPQCK